MTLFPVGHVQYGGEEIGFVIRRTLFFYWHPGRMSFICRTLQSLSVKRIFFGCRNVDRDPYYPSPLPQNKTTHTIAILLMRMDYHIRIAITFSVYVTPIILFFNTYFFLLLLLKDIGGVLLCHGGMSLFDKSFLSLLLEYL